MNNGLVEKLSLKEQLQQKSAQYEADKLTFITSMVELCSPIGGKILMDKRQDPDENLNEVFVRITNEYVNQLLK